MVLARLFAFVSLIYLTRAASLNTLQGYLVMNTTAPASCHDMPSNQLCPSFSHQIVGENTNPQALVNLTLQSVKLQLAVAIFFQDSPACINNLREYSCSNSLMNCTKSNVTRFGFMLTYDIQRTRKACADVQKSCSRLVQEATIHKCSVIQTDPFDFAVCNHHTFFKDDICPRTNYMYPKAITKFYRIFAERFKAEFPIYGASTLKNSACSREVINVYCQILRGGICSANMQQRMYAISQQECAEKIQKCVYQSPFQTHLLESCNLLPDETTATKVPLPIVPATPPNNGNNANNVNSGK